MVFKITKKAEIRRTARDIGTAVKQSVLLSGDWKGAYAVGVVVVDHQKGLAEVHEKSVDVWRVLNGTAKFTLGGALKNPQSTTRGELSSDAIENGEEFEVGEGDVIDIPAGVAHQIDASDGRIELLIVKINNLDSGSRQRRAGAAGMTK